MDLQNTQMHWGSKYNDKTKYLRLELCQNLISAYDCERWVAHRDEGDWTTFISLAESAFQSAYAKEEQQQTEAREEEGGHSRASTLTRTPSQF